LAVTLPMSGIFPRCRRCSPQTRPEVVFHLAAQSLVLPLYRIRWPLRNQCHGTVHLLEAVRKTPSVRVAVNVTSDKCYENHEWTRLREDDPMGGRDPYSQQQGLRRTVRRAYRSHFFPRMQAAPPLASVRAGNVIGGGDGADRLVPDFVRARGVACRSGFATPRLPAHGQHVLEPLYGYLSLAELLWDEGPAHAGGWNFGPRG